MIIVFFALSVPFLQLDCLQGHSDYSSYFLGYKRIKSQRNVQPLTKACAPLVLYSFQPCCECVGL